MIPTACQLCLSSKFYNDKSLSTHCGEIRFFHTVLWVEKCFRHSTLYFVFVYKQTSRAIICSDWSITVLARNWTSSIRRQFLAPEKSGTRKVWQTDLFLVPVDWYQKPASETSQCVITITQKLRKHYTCFSLIESGLRLLATHFMIKVKDKTKNII